MEIMTRFPLVELQVLSTGFSRFSQIASLTSGRSSIEDSIAVMWSGEAGPASGMYSFKGASPISSFWWQSCRQDPTSTCWDLESKVYTLLLGV